MLGALSARWVLAIALLNLVAAASPPQLSLDRDAKARARELVFTEGGQPVQLAPSGLSASSSPGRLLSSAEIHVVNPLDAQLEEIVTIVPPISGVTQKFHPANASLKLRLEAPQESSSILPNRIEDRRSKIAPGVIFDSAQQDRRSKIEFISRNFFLTISNRFSLNIIDSQ